MNLKSDAGSTPLHSAAFFCRVKITEDLLANGADKNLLDAYGSTPYASVAGSFNDVKGIYDQISKRHSQLSNFVNSGYLPTMSNFYRYRLQVYQRFLHLIPEMGPMKVWRCRNF